MKVGLQCPKCQCSLTTSSGGITHLANHLPFIDENGDLCIYTNSGSNDWKCHKCGNEWAEIVESKKRVLQRGKVEEK